MCCSITATPTNFFLYTDDPCESDDGTAHLLGEHQYKGHCIHVTRGDYSPLMKRIVESLKKAKVSVVPLKIFQELVHIGIYRNMAMIVKWPCWRATLRVLLVAVWKTTKPALVTGFATKVLLWRRGSLQPLLGYELTS